MNLSKCVIILGILVLGQVYSAENEAESIGIEMSDDTSSATNDTGPSTAETIAQITNDPGAGFGGDR